MMPEVSLPDWDVLQQLPGYQVVLRAILKSQIKQLIEQLSCFAGEEAILLSASVSDGALSHIGSKSGEVFLNTHEQVKAEFLGFCMKRQQTGHQTETPQQTKSRDHPYTRQTRQNAKKRKLSNDKPVQNPTKLTDRIMPVSRKSTSQTKTTSIFPTGPSGDGKVTQQSKDTVESANEQFEQDNDDASDVASVKEEDDDTDIDNEPDDNDQSCAVSDLDVDIGAIGGLDTDKPNMFNDDTGIEVKQEVQDPESTDPGLAGFQLDPQPTTSGAGKDLGLDMADDDDDDDADDDFKPDEGSDNEWDQATEKTKKKKATELENICSVCGKEYKHRRNLYAHERTHAGKFPYRCCGMGFTSVRGFKRHRYATHGEEASFVCGKCGKTFHTKENLAAHEQREERKTAVSCSICNHKFASKADMMQHMQTHSAEKQVVCQTCGHRFKHRSSMYRHVKSLHT